MLRHSAPAPSLFDFLSPSQHTRGISGGFRRHSGGSERRVERQARTTVTPVQPCKRTTPIKWGGDAEPARNRCRREFLIWHKPGVWTLRRRTRGRGGRRDSEERVAGIAESVRGGRHRATSTSRSWWRRRSGQWRTVIVVVGRVRRERRGDPAVSTKTKSRACAWW